MGVFFFLQNKPAPKLINVHETEKQVKVFTPRDQGCISQKLHKVILTERESVFSVMLALPFNNDPCALMLLGNLTEKNNLSVIYQHLGMYRNSFCEFDRTYF